MAKKKSKKSDMHSKQQSPVLHWLNSRQAEWILVGIIILVAVILRVQNIDSKVMWLDELTEMYMTNAIIYKDLDHYIPRNTLITEPVNLTPIEKAQSIPRFVKEMAEIDSHPPFYYILFYICRAIFGDSPVSLRLLSFIPAIISVLLLYLIGKELYGKISGLGAALIMTLSTPHIVYSHEVRHYSFLIFLGLLALFVYLRIIRSKPNWKLCGVFSILIFLLMVTHYFSFGYIFALGLYSLIKLRGRLLVSILASFVVSVILFLLFWGYPFYLQFFSGSKKAIEALNYRLAPEIAMRSLPAFINTLPERYFLHLPFDYTITRPAFFILLCLLPCVAILWRRDLLLPWLLFICTAFFVVGLDLARGTFHSINIRYTLLAAPAIYMIVAAGIFTGPRKTFLNSIGTIIVVSVLLYNLPTAFEEYRDNWFELSQKLDHNGSSSSPVVLVNPGGPDFEYWSNFIWYTLCYYSYRRDRSVAVIDKPLVSKCIEQIGYDKSIFLITKIPEFPKSVDREWPLFWIPNCTIENAWLLPNRVTVWKVRNQPKEL